MCENSRKSSEFNDGRGVILGYWDQEKTPAVIRDLEDSVDVIESKCKKLLQELIYYQFYSEELNIANSSSEGLPHFTASRRKNSKNACLQSSSAPDVAFRKIQANGLEESFYEKFEKKLTSVNKALSTATSKIGLKDSIFLFPTEDYVKILEENAAENVDKHLSKIQKEFVKTYVKRTVKSDLTLSKAAEKGNNLEISKISKNELEFYKKLSKINLVKKKCKKQIRRKKFKSPTKRTDLKFKKIHRKNKKYSIDNNSNKKYTSQYKNESTSDLFIDATSKREKRKFAPVKNSCRKNKLSKVKIPVFNSHSSHSEISSENETRSASKENGKSSLPKLNQSTDLDIDMMCTSLVDAISKINPPKVLSEPVERNKGGKSNLRSFVTKTVPFTTCTSTTKSFNIGMNLQQFLSLKKYNNSGVRSALRPKPSAQIKTNMESARPNCETSNIEQPECPFPTPKINAFNSNYMVTTYPWSPKEPEEGNRKSNGFEEHEINRVEQKDQWICKSGSISSSERKYRSRYTKTMPQNVIGYHKSTMKQYTNGRESMIKSESKTAYAVGSNIVVSDCRKTNFYGIKKENFCDENASGDGSSNVDCIKLRMEWAKVFTMFSDLCRKYAELKEAANNERKPSDAVLKSLENEIDNALEMYKEFLKFYSKFLQLKHRLKSMKFACETESLLNDSTFFSSFYQRKTNSKRPETYSMILRDTLRKVQSLQDKIKLINDF